MILVKYYKLSDPEQFIFNFRKYPYRNSIKLKILFRIIS